MDRTEGNTDSVDDQDVKSVIPDVLPLKRPGGNNDTAEADLNANIDANIDTLGTNSENPESESSYFSIEVTSVNATCHEQSSGTEVDEPIADEGKGEEPMDSASEVNEMHLMPDSRQAPTAECEEEVKGDVSADIAEEDLMENQIVIQEEELIRNIGEQDGTPTVVVATEGEGGQYEIHMVSSEFGDLAEGLPEGTQLMTEDGQLIHAVQEDEHGNMVVLANHQLAGIHTVDEQTGETVISENPDAVVGELEEAPQHITHDVVSEAAAEAQVSFVQEEILEQPQEMVMLGEDAGYIVTEGESEEVIVGEAPTVEVCAETEVGTTGSETPGVYPDDNMLGKYVPGEGQVVVERIGYQPVQVPAIPHQNEQEVPHEEYFEEEDEEIGYQEDIVISESNHTIPNYDEANEIRMLTEAANNSLKTMEEHFNPPKKRRSRKKKSDGEPSVEDGTRPRKRRRPPHLYFNELGKPTSGRTEALLKGLENLNLPIATAGTAPISPPAPKPEPQVPASKTSVPSSLAAGPAIVHTTPSEIPFIPRHARMTTPNTTPPELSMSHMMSPQMLSPHLKSPRMVSPSLMPPQMASPRMVSPGHQTTQLSPGSISATQKKHPLLSTILSVTSPGAQRLNSNTSPPSAGLPLNQMMKMPRNAPPVSFPFPPKPKVNEYQPQRMASPVISGRQDQTVRIPPPIPPRQAINVLPQQIPRPQLPHMIPSGPNASLQGNTRPDLAKPSYSAVGSVPTQPIYNSPRFQQLVSSIPTNIQPIPAQLPPMSQEAVLPSEAPRVSVQKNVAQQVVPSEQAATGSSQQSDLSSPDRPERNVENNSVVSSVLDGEINANTVLSQGTSEPKPKIQELIKSELLAAAWESRQPVPPAPAVERKIDTNTLSNTISRVEERLKQAAAEAQKQKTEVSKPSNRGPLPPVYSTSAQLTSINQQPTPATVAVRFPSSVPVQGSTLPPISTLQTKLPPGLVPSTLPATSTAELTARTASSSVNKQPLTFRPPPVTAGILESPPVVEEKEVSGALPGQVPVPRGALKSPVSSSGLGKDPMLSGSNLSMPGAQQDVSQANSDVIKNPMQPIVTGRLPAPFPLAFAPGLPPVGLMMQPIPPLGFGRPGMMPQVRRSPEVLSPTSLPTSGAVGISNSSVPPGPSPSRLKSPTADKHKILSSTLQSPPASQPSPLDLIMEVMKKEMSTNPQGLLQGQVPKDAVARHGVIPQTAVKSDKGGPSGASHRLPTPGPTMEMLMAIMQREVAAAQIQAQVAALHAAHAQAQAQASQVGSKGTSNVATSVPHSVRPPLTGSQIGQLQSQAKPSQVASVKSTLPPVSTVMPAASSFPAPTPNQIKSSNEVNTLSGMQPIPQITAQTASMAKPPNQVTAEDSTNSSDIVHGKQRYVNNKTSDDTLADKYMKEWKPTGRFQCKFCYYSCVTQNFLFRHWVMNHCCMKPYLCAYCGLKSPTRDGITRHQTSKHKGNPRRVVIDATQETTLIQNFKALFNLDVKEIHPEDIRMDNIEGLQFPEPYDPRLEKKSPGTANGETDILPTMTEMNHMVKSEKVPLEKQGHGLVPSKGYVQGPNPGMMEQLPPHLREHFMATSAGEVHLDENVGKTSDYLKKHHKKTMIDSIGPVSRYDGLSGPLSKEQLHALAVAQAAEIDRSMSLAQGSKGVETQKLPSISEIRKESRSSPIVGSGNTSNTLPSIRDLIQMPRGQILAMAGLGTSQNSNNTQPTPGNLPFSHTAGHVSHSQAAAVESVSNSKGTQLQNIYPPVQSVFNPGTVLPPDTPVQQDDRPVLPAGVVVPRLPHSKRTSVGNETEHMQSESEAHQAAAQLVSMANSRNVPSRHMTPATPNRVIADQDQQVAAMVSNVAAAAEQQKAALSIEHEVAAQLEDFARRKSGHSGRSPPAAVASSQPNIVASQKPLVSGPQKELAIDQQVALQLEEFRRRKAIIEAQEALKPKKSPKAKSKRTNLSHSGISYQEQRHAGSNSVDEVVAQLHQLAQKRTEDQQVKASTSSGMPISSSSSSAQGNKQAVLPQSTIDEQRLLATQLEELAQRRAAAIQAAIRAQAQQNVTSPVVEREVAAQLAEFADRQRFIDNTIPAAHVEAQKDTMYHLYERAVVESYKSTPASDTEAGRAAINRQPDTPDVTHQTTDATALQHKAQTESSSAASDTQHRQQPTIKESVKLSPETSEITTFGLERSGIVCSDTETSVSKAMAEKVVGQHIVQYANTEGQEGNKTAAVEIDSIKSNRISQKVTHEIGSPLAKSMMEMKVPPENIAGVVTDETMKNVCQGNPVSEEKTVMAVQTVVAQADGERASDSAQFVQNSTGNTVLSQHTVSRSTNIMESSPVQLGNVLQDSEMSDMSDRTSISPGLNATTPEMECLTPEHNIPPNEN